jgi:HSP20 family protein
MGNVKVQKDKNEDDENNGEKGIVERRKYYPWMWFPEFDHLMRDFQRGIGSWFMEPFREPAWLRDNEPRMDIKATEKEYIIHADVPGFEKDDISLELRDDRLKLTAEKKEESEEKGQNYIRRERGYRSFSRTVILPDDAQLNEDIDASLDKGVLEIHVPRSPDEESNSRKIDIK